MIARGFAQRARRRVRAKLVDSLLAHLADFGDVHRATGRLHIHPNTLRYRTPRRFESVSGIGLSDPNERLFTHLQLLMEHDR